MGTVTILSETPKNPLQVIGEMAGICWESPVDDAEKNRKRALNCIESGHGRVLEYVDVYLKIEGYSARVIREWYTHIGGAPTRLQSSTRYVDGSNFSYVIPPSVLNDENSKNEYLSVMETIRSGYVKLLEMNIPKEDAANVLPLGMTTKIVDKRNLRNLIDMSRQRMCSRAYHEYRALFSDIRRTLSSYSDEWKWIVENQLYAKCEETKTCKEAKSCGRYPKAQS